MKRVVSNVLFGLIFLVGLGILLYPTVSNQWNTYRQSRLISSYEEHVKEMKEEDFSAEWDVANSFNAELLKNDLYGDAFGIVDTDLTQTAYWKVLNIAGDGVMGYLSIPKINIKLAIYHGTDETVLQTGIGHLSGSKLPIGGTSNHSVLAAHRGLPSAKLFTDIDQLVIGDMFYVYILDQVFAYRVDQVLDMVDKDDNQALEAALGIVEGEDHVSLFTCTPYGVNSHRLIVRGSRVPYEPGEKEEVTRSASETMLESVQNYYMFYLIIGLSATVLIIVIIRFVINRRDKKSRKK